MRPKVRQWGFRLGLGLWVAWMRISLGLRWEVRLGLGLGMSRGRLQVRVWMGKARFMNDSGVLSES